MAKNSTPKALAKQRSLSAKAKAKANDAASKKRPATAEDASPRSSKKAKQQQGMKLPPADDMEEGEVEEALFMIDSEPSKPTKEPKTAAAAAPATATLDAAASDDSDSDSDDEYDQDDLKKAIQDQIIDDSAAKSTGRYYKEVDLTRSCVLCGVQGHSARDCPHEQCFVCGQIDSGHDARSCPAALVCNNCGSRGHIARTCSKPRIPFDRKRCQYCGSDRHLTINCQNNWRVYVTAEASRSPKKKQRDAGKSQIMYACANCAARDHFIDDCRRPRGHPLKFAERSAFNRDALENLAPQPLASRPPPAVSYRFYDGRDQHRRFDQGDQYSPHDPFIGGNPGSSYRPSPTAQHHHFQPHSQPGQSYRPEQARRGPPPDESTRYPVINVRGASVSSVESGEVGQQRSRGTSVASQNRSRTNSPLPPPPPPPAAPSSAATAPSQMSIHGGNAKHQSQAQTEPQARIYGRNAKPQSQAQAQPQARLYGLAGERKESYGMFKGGTPSRGRGNNSPRGGMGSRGRGGSPAGRGNGPKYRGGYF